MAFQKNHRKQGRWVDMHSELLNFKSVIWSLVICDQMVTRQDILVARVLVHVSESAVS